MFKSWTRLYVFICIMVFYIVQLPANICDITWTNGSMCTVNVVEGLPTPITVPVSPEWHRIEWVTKYHMGL